MIKENKRSIYYLMRKPESELSDFEKTVVESQKQAFKVKKDLEEKVGETSYGVEIGGPHYPDLSEEQQKIEFESFYYGTIAFVDALLYLTDNCKSQLEFPEYLELFNYIKENYPQTIYGNEDIHKGSFLLPRRFRKAIDENGIPVSQKVDNAINNGCSDMIKSEFQQYYMSQCGLNEAEAKEMVNHTKITSYTFNSGDSIEKIQDDIKRKQEWDDMIDGKS